LGTAVTALAAGQRLAAAGMAILGAGLFAAFVSGAVIRFVANGVPVEPSWAGIAWGACLAGLPMAALAYFTVAILVRPLTNQNAWDRMARECLAAGLIGLGACACLTGAGLGVALTLNGASPLHSAGSEYVGPAIAALCGLGVIVLINTLRMDCPWLALGHIVWGLVGVVALTVGAPMLVNAVMIDDVRILSLRYNLFVLFYPVLWAAYAGLALALTAGGLRAIRFALATQDPAERLSKDAEVPAAAIAVPVHVATSLRREDLAA
jgi:hypothetical protein